MPFSFRILLRLLVAGLLLTAALAACDQEAPEPVASSTTVAQTAQPSPTPTAVPDTPTPLPTATSTPVPPTATPTPPPEPTATPQPTATATATPQPTATATATPQPTATPTPEPTAEVAEGFPLTIQSTDGREIVFERPPERIVAFDSALVEILFAIGEGDRVVGTHDFVSYPPETESVERVGDAFNMNIEAVVALEPDLVYVFFDRFVPDLERAGLKVLYIETLTLDFTKVADNIRLWGQIVGNPERAELVAQTFEDRVEAIRAAVEQVDEGPTIFQDVGGFWTPGAGTLVQEVFDLLKLRNIAFDVEGYAQLSPEVIVEENPAIIISGSPESFTGDPAFANVQAVKDEAVYSLGSDALSIAGPRFVEGIEEIFRLVYPKLFEQLAEAA